MWAAELVPLALLLGRLRVVGGLLAHPRDLRGVRRQHVGVEGHPLQVALRLAQLEAHLHHE
eukprot:13193715-Alexandrium_andersonii.AAC.1